MLKQLTLVVSLSVLMVACGSDDKKKGNSNSSVSSVAPSSVASSVAPSSVASSEASSSVASSEASSSVASSEASSSVASSVAPSSVASSEASSSVASSSEASSSEASSSEASSSVASSSSSAASCEDWETAIPCDASRWVVDGGNGGSILQGEYGPIFVNGAPTGTDSWNKPGMFFVLDADNQTVIGKTLTIMVVVDQDLKDSGAAIQPVIQQNGGGYGGFWSCQTNNGDLLVDGETEVSCTHTGDAPANGIASLRLGFQLNGLSSETGYAGTIEVVYASWE